MISVFDIRPRLGFFYRFTQLYRDQQKHLKAITAFTNKIVKERRLKVEDGTITKDDFIIDYYFFHMVDGRYLTDYEIARELDTMILGVHDTTQNVFSFMMYHLAKYPEVQQKVYDEAYMIFKDDLNPNRDLLEEDVNNLPYMEAVIKETLRMFPPVPFVGRKLDSEITVGELTFPKDIEIIMSPYMMGRNPKYFDDPLTFNPDRFLGVDVMPLAFTPFSIGAKKCIGGRIAMIGLKLAMAKVVWNFKVSLPAKGHEELELICELVLATKGNVPVVLEKRF
jgi:cytochrome P450 family 4